MTPLDLVNLTPLVRRTSGRPEVAIGLIDGPVDKAHPELSQQHLHETSVTGSAACTEANRAACSHGTFVAGILSARRESAAPAICPDCTLIVRPIFGAATLYDNGVPGARPEELARAILDCIAADARVLNISAALDYPSLNTERELEGALDLAASRGVVVIAAAGNQGTLGSTSITRHPWVIPVVAFDLQGKPMAHSNFGSSIGRRGLGAPGYAITSLGTNGQTATMSGTSVAAPFVTGAIALLWSEHPSATAVQVRHAVIESHVVQRRSIVPPLLNAWAAYQNMKR
jgi:subtilisin family serine protease